MDEPWHGTVGGYTNHKCRCVACRAVKTAEHKAYRARLAVSPWEAIPHGTATGYANWGCRCPACSAAYSSVRKRWASYKGR
jgi:hypothetical protein